MSRRRAKSPLIPPPAPLQATEDPKAREKRERAEKRQAELAACSDKINALLVEAEALLDPEIRVRVRNGVEVRAVYWQVVPRDGT